MTKKTIIIVVGIFLLIFSLAKISSWRLQKWGGGFNKEGFLKFEGIDLGQLKQLKEFTGQNTPGTKEFINNDGKLKITYPNDWLEIENQEILQAAAPTQLKDKHNLETIFWAQRPQKEFAQLIIYKGTFDLTIEEIIEEIKKTNQEQGWGMEVVSFSFREKEGTFEAKYKAPDNNFFHSKEKILAADKNETYLIGAITLEKDWLTSINDIDKILGSATIIKQ